LFLSGNAFETNRNLQFAAIGASRIEWQLCTVLMNPAGILETVRRGVTGSNWADTTSSKISGNLP
jgi:hypothetical protein